MTLQSEDDEHLSDCDCHCQNRPNPEYEVVSSDSSFHVDDSDNSSDSAVLYNHNVRFESVVYNFNDVVVKFFISRKIEAKFTVLTYLFAIAVLSLQHPFICIKILY